MNYILKLLLTAVAVIIIGYIIPGVSVDEFSTAIWVAFVLGLLYTFLKPILVVLTIPVTIITLGLFLFVLNALIVLLANSMIDGFHVSGFWTALIFSILLSFVESILHKLIE